MRGVPADLPLEPFVGDECCQIGVGRYQLQFRFGRAGRISVEGKWELRDPSGAVIDQGPRVGLGKQSRVPEQYRIHYVLDVPVTRYAIDAPRSFTLFFQINFDRAHHLR